MPSHAVILPAAGRSSRFRDAHYKKPFAPLANRAVWLHAADRFLSRRDVVQLIVVISPEDREEFQAKFGANLAILGVELVLGGAERADSVGNALAKVRPDVDLVCVHDAARPCLANEWIDRVFEAAAKTGAAILATPVTGTLKRAAPDGRIESTVSREALWEAQTPQVFRRQLLLDAYAARNGRNPTDEAQLVEWLGHPIQLVQGSPLNLKITTKDDLRFAALALQALPPPKLGGVGNPLDDMWR